MLFICDKTRLISILLIKFCSDDVMSFSCADFDFHKRVVVVNSIGTRFCRNVFEVIH